MGACHGCGIPTRHFCRVVWLQMLPGCDLEPGWASKSPECGKCGACAAEWGPRRLPRAGIFMGSRGSNPIPADGSGGRGGDLRLQRSRTPSAGNTKDMAARWGRWPNPVLRPFLNSLWLPSGDPVSDSFLVRLGGGFGTHFGPDLERLGYPGT